MPTVTLAISPGPRQVREEVLRLPEGATAGDALRMAGVALAAGEALAVWGRRADPGRVLVERDRVEVLRPLRVDPKVARRERFRKQGSRAAGLFATRRPGGKAGY